MDDLAKVYNLVGEPALYEQMAEECCELAQVCLKMARKLRAENPTPVEKEEIEKNILEESTDLMLVAQIINEGTNDCLFSSDLNIRKHKIQRWLDRLSSQQK